MVPGARSERRSARVGPAETPNKKAAQALHNSAGVTICSIRPVFITTTRSASSSFILVVRDKEWYFQLMLELFYPPRFPRTMASSSRMVHPTRASAARSRDACGDPLALPAR